MARKDVRVIIPENAKGLIDLANKIIKKYKADNSKSPLSGFSMTDMENKNTIAGKKHTLAKKLSREAEAAIKARNLALGKGKDQQSTTPGTILFYVTSIRDMLLGLFKGQEHKLRNWGFDVDVSTRVGSDDDLEQDDLAGDKQI